MTDQKQINISREVPINHDVKQNTHGPSAPILPKRQDVDLRALHAILERAEGSPLQGEEIATLKNAVDTLAALTTELASKDTSLARLRRWLFGGSTEKASAVLGPEGRGEAAPAPAGGKAEPTGGGPGKTQGEPEGPRKPGHGRNGASAYKGAQRVEVEHSSLKAGDKCPGACAGKVHPIKEPGLLLRVMGMPPLQATVYACSRLRCGDCGEVFTAEAPAGVGTQKYDESATAMVGLLRYGVGVPFNRMETLQENLGIPLPASTQWDLVDDGADRLECAHEELERTAAAGRVLHNDDTPMKVLALMGEGRAQALAAELETGEEHLKDRKGVQTTGIVSECKGHRVALFYTGVKHAGEHLADVLKKRSVTLSPPIQMCDGLAANTAGEFVSILANCAAHARRGFVDEVNNFPEECRIVLESFSAIYKHEAHCHKHGLSPQERLAYHQQHSGPVMGRMQKWMRAQGREKKVEPASGLGHAIAYVLKRWKPLTMFLRLPGVPLDNNVCERALKKAIRHRKASLFYKTLNGARVGDRYMSLIHTAELNGANAFDYLVSLLRHQEAVRKKPEDWMPWNYRQTLAALNTPL